MKDLFGNTYQEKARYKRNIEREVLQLLEVSDRGLTFYQLNKKLKLDNHTLTVALNIMRQTNKIDYNTINQRWKIIRRFYGD